MQYRIPKPGKIISGFADSKKIFLMPIDPRFFLKRDCKHTLLFFWALH